MCFGEWITEWGHLVDAIRGLEPGDTVRIVTVGPSHPNVVLEVVHDDNYPTPLGEASIAVDESGNEYIVEPTWEHRGDENPWLRKDGKSAGEINSIQLK